MKKALVAALVLTFVLSIAATASAAVLTPASFPDVEGKACADAVAKLEALGIGKGIDGKWMPELPVTRAQFAAFAVRLMGLEGVVKYMAGPTKFPDVPASHWASGYVNVAVAKKLLAGYPDGTFHPDENITFPQAATVLGRVLGYVNLPGEWPANYMVVASENGLFEGVEFGGDFVTRGDMAIMLANALDAQVVQYKYLADLGIADYEKLWDDTAKTDPTTVLEKFLGASVKSGVVTANADVDSTLKAAEIKLDTTKLAVPSKVDTAAILGHELSTIVKSGNVLFAEDVTASDKIVTGELTADATASTIEIEDTEYAWADTPIVYLNRVRVAQDVYAPLDEGVQVTAFLDDEGKVRFVAASSYAVSDYLVTAIDSTAKTITVVYHTWTGSAWQPTGARTFNVASAAITKDGKAATFADIAKGDVAYVAVKPSDPTTATVVALYSATFTGVLTGVQIKADAATYLKFADGTEKKLSSKAVAYMDTSGAQVASLVGYPVTVTLNATGAARVVKASAAGIVGRYLGAVDTNKLKLNVAGSEVVVEKATRFTGSIPSEGTPVLVTTNAEGKATKIEALAESQSYTIVGIDTSAGKVTVQTGTNPATYSVWSVASNAIAEIGARYGKLADLEVGSQIKGYSSSATGAYYYLVVTTPVKQWLYGKFLGYLDTGEGLEAYFDEKGTTVSRAVYVDAVDEVKALTVGDFVYCNVDLSKGVISAAEFTEPAINDGTVVAVSGTKVTVKTTVGNTDTYYVVDLSTASIYKGDDKVPATAADVTLDAVVKVYRHAPSSGSVVDAIVWIQE